MVTTVFTQRYSNLTSVNNRLVRVHNSVTINIQVFIYPTCFNASQRHPKAVLVQKHQNTFKNLRSLKNTEHSFSVVRKTLFSHYMHNRRLSFLKTVTRCRVSFLGGLYHTRIKIILGPLKALPCKNVKMQ
jgi:hypothetical protein